ncbi:MAG: Gfo/Idh/MocA family oxidoreductase [Candidatus Poribacteria bacterium]|nr:Gfo/Idh/MocA family oxidoreductase [Candidatus Poribacteria bacterium]
MTRIGVIGTGGMGSAHCNSLPKVENCEFVGVADLRLEAAQEIAETHQIRAFQDYHDLLEIVDGVVVATPPAAHREVVVAAAEVGVHAFCEKPLSLTLADADAMIEASEKSGTHLMVGQVLRFYSVHVLGKQLVDDGEIGSLVYLETDYTGAYRGPRERPSSWYGTVGGFLENGIHKSDLINWFGGTALTVAAEVGSHSGHKDWEDYAVTLIRYDSEAVGLLRWGSFMGARGTNETIIDGSKGSLRLDMRADVAYLKRIGESEWKELLPDRTVPHGVVGELTHFVDCIRDGTTPLVDGRAGRHAVEVVLASYRSAKERIKVALPMQD